MQELEKQSIEISEQCEQLFHTSSNMSKVIEDVKTAAQPVEIIENELGMAMRTLCHLSEDPFFERSSKTFLRYVEGAIEMHTYWLMTLQKMVDMRALLPLQLNHERCGFGSFYYAIEPKGNEAIKIWRTLEERHIYFHTEAKKVIKAIVDEDFSFAQKVLEELNTKSEEFIADIRKIIEFVEK